MSWRPFRVRTMPSGIVGVSGVLTHGLDTGGVPDTIDPGLYPSAPVPSTGYIPYFEALDSNDEDRRNSWKDCSHYKRTVNLSTDALQWRHLANDRLDSLGPYWSASPGIPAWIAWGASGTFGEIGLPLWGLPDLFVPVGSESGSVIPYFAPDQYIADSITAMLPGIKAKLSLINSLIELKDFKSLPRTIRNIRNLIPTTEAPWNLPLRKIFRELKKKKPKKYANVQTGSDGYLQYHFNIAPLLSDIVGLTTAIQDVRSQINRLKSNQAKRNKSHFSRPIPDFIAPNTASVLVIPQGIDPTFDGNLNCKRVSTGSAMFNATMEYSYILPSMSDEEFLIKGLLDRVGVKFSPRIIWNAIPWTFVVDWVADVGQFLDNFGSRNIEPVTNVHRYCYSIKVLRTTIASIANVNTLHGDTGFVPTSQVNEEAYIRRIRPILGLDMYRLVRLSGLNPQEFRLGGALIGSRL